MRFLIPTTIEVDTGDDSSLTPKTAHLLRRRLVEQLEETVRDVLAEQDIFPVLDNLVSIDPIEVLETVEEES